MNDLNYELVVKIVSIMLSAIPLISLALNWPFNKRKKLKIDLSLLKLLDKDDESYKILKAHIDNRINQYYRRSRNIKVYHKWEFILAIGYGLVCSFIAVISYSEGSWEWWFFSSVFFINFPIILISSLRKTSLLYMYSEK